MTPKLRRILAEQRQRTDALEKRRRRIVPWVFHRGGEPIRAFRRSWLMACAKAGLAREVRDAKGRLLRIVGAPIPHDLRRSAVMRLEEAGVPRTTAMAMVGHRTESVYRRYAVPNAKAMRDGADKLAALGSVTVPAMDSTTTTEEPAPASVGQAWGKSGPARPKRDRG